MLDEDAWRTNLKMMGVDITTVPPATIFDSTSSQAARSTELFLRLREGEKKKFYRKEKTDKESGISYNRNEIMELD